MLVQTRLEKQKDLSHGEFLGMKVALWEVNFLAFKKIGMTDTDGACPFRIRTSTAKPLKPVTK